MDRVPPGKIFKFSDFNINFIIKKISCFKKTQRKKNTPFFIVILINRTLCICCWKILSRLFQFYILFRFIVVYIIKSGATYIYIYMMTMRKIKSKKTKHSHLHNYHSLNNIKVYMWSIWVWYWFSIIRVIQPENETKCYNSYQKKC